MDYFGQRPSGLSPQPGWSGIYRRYAFMSQDRQWRQVWHIRVIWKKASLNKKSAKTNHHGRFLVTHFLVILSFCLLKPNTAISSSSWSHKKSHWWYYVKIFNDWLFQFARLFIWKVMNRRISIYDHIMIFDDKNDLISERFIFNV